MDQLHATIHKASQEVRLDPVTKAGFRRTLEVMTEAAAPAAAPARFPRALAWALAAIVAAGSGATATYASAQSLPGEALYSVKVNLLEPAEEALAFSAEAKAAVAVSHIERRYQEAALLSASGRLAAYDGELAARAEKDVAVVDRDDQPVARARFQALASVYGDRLKIADVKLSRFALAVRLGDGKDRVTDDTARATAKEQLALARSKGDAVKKGKVSAEVTARLSRVSELSDAANEDLDRGAYQAALKLSAAAAQAAREAEIFAGVAATSTPATITTSTAATTTPATTTGSTSTTTTSTTPAVLGTSTGTTSYEARATVPQPGDLFRSLFR